ncbi:AAA family ATPase [Candidatus Gracilibacteria bacterium]|nr:AAA family ATPase [Candidatus Gracilibacteria bacterium]
MVRKIKDKNDKKSNSYTEIHGELQELNIKNFKQFNNVKFTDFDKINIFFGDNNCGKSSLLEAIFTYACGYNHFPALNQLTGKRDKGIKGFYDYGDKLISIFKENNESLYEFEISGKFNGVDKEIKTIYSFNPSAELSALDPRNMGYGNINFDFAKQQSSEESQNINGIENIIPNIPSKYIGQLNIDINNKVKKFDLLFPKLNITIEKPLKVGAIHDILSHRDTKNDMQIYSHLKRYNILSEMEEEMRKSFPIVENIDYMPYPDGNSGSIYIRTKDNRNLPLYVFGDGMRRWFYLLGRMIVSQNSIHCIEEIDATLHFEAQENFSANILSYTEKYNNQLFITSHSIEFADKFLETLYGDNGVLKGKKEDPVRFFSLKSVKTDSGYDLDIWKLSGREAYSKRQDFGLELR